MIEWSLQTTQQTKRDNVRNSICVIPSSFPLNCVNHGLYTVMHFSRRFPDNFVLWSKTVDCPETACQVLRKRLNGWVPQIYYCDALWFLNSLRPRLNRRPFADNIFKCIFSNENEWFSPRISLKFVPKVRINNIPALVQIMAWRRPGDKPLSEPVMVSLLTHICVTRPQWVKFSITVSLGVCWVRKYTNVLRQSSQGQNLNELSVGQKCVQLMLCSIESVKTTSMWMKVLKYYVENKALFEIWK